MSNKLWNTFASRTSKRNSSQSHNGKKDRPNSTNENEKDEDQKMRELEAKINRYNTEQVNEAFKRFLADTNIPREKQGPLLQKSTEERRTLILWHEKCKEIMLIQSRRLIVSNLFINAHALDSLTTSSQRDSFTRNSQLIAQLMFSSSLSLSLSLLQEKSRTEIYFDKSCGRVNL
jgi:hypothetical protein